jgi:hypothetical protein
MEGSASKFWLRAIVTVCTWRGTEPRKTASDSLITMKAKK